MDNLLNSRLSRDQSPAKLENLSPEKFGKGAYASLTYTPSKLADNVLYKEVSTFKKIQQQSSKVRESQAFNSLLKDRLSQIQEERDGIEQTLTQQILMYKKMLNENEAKHEQRLKDIQRNFNQEMQKIILSKEEEAKFAQSEKELLEGRISQLEIQVSELREQLEHGGSNYDELTKEHEKLEIHYKNTCQKLEQTEARWKADSQKTKNDYEQLSRKLFNTEVEFKSQLEKLQVDRERQKESLERLHKVELEKVQNKRLHQAMIKNQELKDLTATFEGEANRLKDIITSKEKSIENLNNVINDEKQRFIDLTKNSTEEVTNLIHEKNRFKEEVDGLNVEVAKGKQAYKDLQVSSDKEISNRDALVSKLKDELELSQVSFIREKDKLNYMIDDLHRENVLIKSENDRLALIADENSLLCSEIRNLKDLLLESSLEMEKCKDEFLRIGREKDLLTVKVRELGYENETLHRMKFEKEEEARGWRESYYLSRR